MNKDLKMVHNVLQCLLCNSSRFHYLEPLRKGVIEKMAYLVEFWLILESELVERAPHMEYLLYGSENGTKNTKDCTLTNTFGLTEFGSVMNKL
jgi:hypothetical protein